MSHPSCRRRTPLRRTSSITPPHRSRLRRPARSRVRPALAIGIALALLGAAPADRLLPGLSPIPAAQAQQRPIPAGARLGVLKVGIFPAAELDGNPLMLGAGMRIYDTNNVIVMPGVVQGRALRVAYVTGQSGELTQAWIVTDAEYKAIRARK